MKTFQKLTDPPRTPNGAIDLLSGDASVPPPTLQFLSKEFADNEKEDKKASEGEDQSIYATLGSFEEKMENELQDLEQFGVGAGRTSTTNMKKKAQDPDGEGERPPPSTIFAKASSAATSAAASFAPSSPFKKGKGKSGRSLTMLSGKTTKIMSDYQAYLSEIQNEFPVADNDKDDDDIEIATDPALANIHQARENIRDSYSDLKSATGPEGGCHAPDDEEGGIVPFILSREVAEREDNYATGGGEPLHRAWSPRFRDNTSYVRDDLSAISEEDLQRYSGSHALPWLHSKRVKRGLVSLVALAAIASFVSIGIVSSNAKKHDETLPDWEGEYIAEVEEKETDMEEELAKDDIILTSVLGPPKGEHTPEIKKESTKDDIIPTSVLGLPKDEHTSEIKKESAKDDTILASVLRLPKDEHTPEIKKEASRGEIILASVLEPPKAEHIPEIKKEENQVEGDGANDFHSQGQSQTMLGWEGNHAATLEKKEEKKDQWVDNVQYSFGHKILTGTPLALPSPEVGKEIWDLYRDATQKFHPILYDRSNGWKGQSYIDALVFCEQKVGLALCPYEAVCPNATDGKPLGGYREPHNGDWAWIPILNGHNTWVQVGELDRCFQYSDMHGGESPKWGTTGNGNEEMTQNVMCCRME